jgi:PAS domain S-box-containing protein
MGSPAPQLPRLERARTDEEYRALVTAAPVGLFRADATGRCVFVNAAWCETTGLTADEAVGEGWTGVLHGGDRVRVVGEWSHAVSTGGRFRSEYRLELPEGDIVWVHAVAEPLHHADGSVAGFVGSLADITERRELDLALLDRDATLRTFYDGSPLLMGVVELAGNDLLHVSQNAATARLFGTTPEAMDHRLASEMGAPGPLRRKWMRHVREAAAARGPVRFEFRHVVGTDRRWFCATVSPIDSPHRTRPRFAYVVEDATERRRAEQMLAARTAELARSNQELERFAYVASHDLQEPLRTMAGYAQLLAERYRGRMGQEADDFVGFIVDASDRMRELIQGLLAYARVSTERPSRDQVDVEALVREVVAHLHAAAEERGAVIAVGPLPRVAGSAGQLRQLFQNLITNAIKFSADGPPEVKVTAERASEEVVFGVADNGIGLDPAEADRIFEIFQRLHGRMEYPGAGIGLAICRRVVEQHGGRIWVESAPGRGATFKFTLPAAESSVHPSPRPRR